MIYLALVLSACDEPKSAQKRAGSRDARGPSTAHTDQKKYRRFRETALDQLKSSQSPEHALNAKSGGLFENSDQFNSFEARVEKLQLLPEGSKERSTAVDTILNGTSDVGEIELLYGAVPAGMDRQRVASKLIVSTWRQSQNVDSVVDKLLGLEYQEEFESGATEILSKSSFRNAITEEPVARMLVRINQSNEARRLLLGGLLPKFEVHN